MERLAVLSFHTSPLAQPGTGDGGGMNVYVRELAAALARSGAECDVFTRATSPQLAPVAVVEPGFRVHHVPAGPPAPMAKEQLLDVVDEFTKGVRRAMEAAAEPFEAIHANYWLSGLAGHELKHHFDLPLVSTFHTLDRVKAEAGPEEVQAGLAGQRAQAEATIIGCSDAVLASCSVEARQIADLYGADDSRIRVVAPGVDHAFFGPGYRPQARRALGLPEDEVVLLSVGRIQPLKGMDVSVRSLAELSAAGRRCRLLVVGGPSGPHGEEALADLWALAGALGVTERLQVVDPQPHELLSTFYRAADVCLVPSRSESFGLVALEAAACGTPVVASAVGGLTTLVDHGRTGFLVEGADPGRYADYVSRVLDEPLLAERLSSAAVLRARRYTWRGAAASWHRLHDELLVKQLVDCT